MFANHKSLAWVESNIFNALIFQCYYWAIGSSPGSIDLQDFQYVGLNQTATNSSLEGLLHHNHTYYVTVIARNGAGLENVYEFEGKIQ